MGFFEKLGGMFGGGEELKKTVEESRKKAFDEMTAAGQRLQEASAAHERTRQELLDLPATLEKMKREGESTDAEQIAAIEEKIKEGN